RDSQGDWSPPQGYRHPVPLRSDDVNLSRWNLGDCAFLGGEPYPALSSSRSSLDHPPLGRHRRHDRFHHHRTSLWSLASQGGLTARPNRVSPVRMKLDKGRKVVAATSQN